MCTSRLLELSIVLAAGTLIVGCGGGSGSPLAPTRNAEVNVGSTAPQQPLSLTGSWSGSYFVVGEISGNDGTMTLTLVQNGATFSGQFTIKNDLLLGDVTGAVTGTIVPNGYTFKVSAPAVSGFPGCSMQLDARQLGVGSGAVLQVLQGSYKQTLCGRTSNLENGNYQLFKR